MLDLNGELDVLIEGLQQADVEFAVAGSLAGSLRRRSGVQRSVDLAVWPEDRHAAEAVVHGLEYLDMGPLKAAQAGRYHLHRLIKTGGSDILALNLVVPASFVTAMGLGACRTIPWRRRRVKITGRVTARDLERGPVGHEVAGAFWLFWPDHETWSERDLFPRFDALVEAPESATDADVEALLVGLSSRCPLRWPWERIIPMLDGLPASLTGQSPALTAYAGAVRARTGPGRDVRRYFRTTPEGLEWT